MRPAATMPTSTRSRRRRSVTGLVRRWAQRVADPPDGVDEGGTEGIDLASEIGDVDLDHIGVAVEVVVPHPVENLRLGHHPPGIEQEIVEKFELGGGEVDGGAPPEDFGALLFESEVAEF